MALDAKVKKYSGATTGLTTVSMMEALKQGVDFVLGVVKTVSPQNLPMFTRRLEIGQGLSTGYISGISLVSGGSNYSGSAGITFTGGGGTGAEGWITLTSANGNVINGVGLGSGPSSPVSRTGQGYSSTPTVTITNPGSPSSNASFTVTTVIKDGLDLGPLNIFDVVRVERDSQIARRLKDELRFKAKDTKSIYYSTASNPAYIVNSENVLAIFPDATNTAKANVYCISSASGKTITLDTEEIKDEDITAGGVNNIGSERFPAFWKELVVLHAAEIILVERLGTMRSTLPTDLDDATAFNEISDASVSLGSMSTSLPNDFSHSTSLPSLTATTFPTTDVNDALTKAKNLIDDGAGIGGNNASVTGMSAQYWLSDEDEDMVASTLQLAAQELNRASVVLSDYKSELDGNIQAFNSNITKYQQEIAKESQRTGIRINKYQAELSQKVQNAQNELAEYQANVGKKVQLFNTAIQKINTDVGWIAQQLQVVTSKKQEFIQSVGASGAGETQERGI